VNEDGRCGHLKSAWNLRGSRHFLGDLLLAFFSSEHAYVTGVATGVDYAVVDGLENGAALFIDMLAVGVEAFAEVWAELDKAGSELLGWDIPRGEGADARRVGQPASTG